MNLPERRNPWLWVPSLYFAEGLPYVVALTVSVIMYKRLGISNTDIALYTSLLYLPWVIKPFWAPIVDMVRTKRLWILMLQLALGVSLAAVAVMIPAPGFFRATLLLFWLMAFSSATHDIAADGFYMLALEEHEQAVDLIAKSMCGQTVPYANELPTAIVTADGLAPYYKIVDEETPYTIAPTPMPSPSSP